MVGSSGLKVLCQDFNGLVINCHQPNMHHVALVLCGPEICACIVMGLFAVWCVYFNIFGAEICLISVHVVGSK